MSLRQAEVYTNALLHMEGTATRRAVTGGDWTLTEHLLALAVDALRIANWQRTKDGRKGRSRPKPISPLSRDAGTRYGGGHGKTDDEVKAYLARFGPPPS